MYKCTFLSMDTMTQTHDFGKALSLCTDGLEQTMRNKNDSATIRTKALAHNLLQSICEFGAVAMQFRIAARVPQRVPRPSVALAERSHAATYDAAIRVLPLVSADES
jgi:hypothetical protein